MNRNPKASTLLSVAMLVAAGIALAGILRSGDTAMGANPQTMSSTNAPVGPTPTIAVPLGASIANARTQLAQQNPGWADFIAAVETANVQQVVRFLDWQSHSCAGPKGGDAPLCSSLGAAVGTSIAMFPEDDRGALPLPKDQLGEAMFYRDRTSLETSLTQLLSGRHPTLELVLQGNDNQLYLSFSLDAEQNPVSGAPVVSVSFRAPDPKTPTVRVFAEGVQSTTPFEVVRGQQRQGYTFDIWGISDQLRSRELAVHQERYDSPAHNAPPTR